MDQLHFEEMPPLDRFTKHFNKYMFQERLREDERLNKVEVETLAKAGVDGILTDTSDNEDEDAGTMAA